MGTSCVSCKSPDARWIGAIPCTDLFAGRRLAEPRDGGSLYACRSCRLLYRYPRPGRDELAKLYREGAEDHWQYQPAAREDWRIASQRIARLGAGARVLDIGCFDGAFLAQLGGDVERCGIEIHEEAAARATRRGIRIIANDLAEMDDVDELFDAVIALDVIEHVPDPFQSLLTFARATRPGGVIMLATGNAEAPSWRFMRSRYWYCTIAEHLSFVSPRWCEQAARRSGLRVESFHRFSHHPARLPRRVAETAKNALYRIAPGVAARLRAGGFGGKDASAHPELIAHPPCWTSARDHFIVVLEKSAS